MFIKMTIYSLFIAIQLSFAADNLEISEEELAQNKAYNQALYTFLRHNSSPKIQLISYSSYLSDEEKDFKAIKQVLDKTINTKSDEQTLFLADNLCHTDKKLKSWCHKKQIHQIHQQVDPENIMTYVNALHDEESPQSTSKWVNLVSNKSSYSNSFFFELSLLLSEQVSLFNQSNPSLFNNEREINNLSKRAIELRLIEKGLINQNYRENFPKTVAIIESIGIVMAQTVAFRYFTEPCKNDRFTNQCKHFSTVLQSSKSYLDAMIGEAIGKMIGETSQTSNKWKQLSCFISLNDVNATLVYNSVLAQQYLKDAIEFSEVEAWNKLAYKVYNIERSHGFNPDFNPHDCEKNLKGID